MFEPGFESNEGFPRRRNGPVLPRVGMNTRNWRFSGRVVRHFSDPRYPTSLQSALPYTPPIPLATAALRSAAACRQTAAASDDSPPGATNSSGRV